jgi:hypothetical protein
VTYLEALHIMLYSNTWSGTRQEASQFLARLLELRAEAPPGAPLERIWSTSGQAYFSLYFEGLLWQPSLWLEQVFRESMEVGLERTAMGAQTSRAEVLEALGDRAGAELLLREGLTLARRLDEPLVNFHAVLHLALFLAGSSEPAQREEALALTNGLEIEHLHHLSGKRSLLRAKVAVATGDLSEAERQASKACEQLAALFVFDQLKAQAVLSQVLLTQGRAAEAREGAARGVRELEARGGTGLPAVSVYLALAEACLAEGDTQEGEASLRKALQCVHSRARDIPDAAARQRFLLQVPENARTVELAHQRWGEAVRC